MNTEHCEKLLQVQLLKYPEVSCITNTAGTKGLKLIFVGGWGRQGKTFRDFGNLSAFQPKEKLSFLAAYIIKLYNIIHLYIRTYYYRHCVIYL